MYSIAGKLICHNNVTSQIVLTVQFVHTNVKNEAFSYQRTVWLEKEWWEMISSFQKIANLNP